MPQVKMFLSRIFTSSLYATLLTLLILVAGVIAGLYPEEVKSSFPFRLASPTPGASIFWCTSLAAALLFFFRENAVDRKRSEAANQLESIIRTMPPDNFLELFRVVYNDCLRVSTDPSSNAAKRIRIVLQGVITLVRRFERSPHRVRYAANVMPFVKPTELDSPAMARLRNILWFHEPGADLAKLAGVLVTQRELSTALEVAPDDTDSRLATFALPVVTGPLRTAQGLWRALPGAPLAFMRHAAGEAGVDGYQDTLTLAQQTKFDLRPATLTEIGQYFASDAGRDVQSFLSFALSQPAEQAVGVLNIHQNVTGLLSGQRGTQFYELMGPFIAIFVTLLGQWKTELGDRNLVIPPLKRSDRVDALLA